MRRDPNSSTPADSEPDPESGQVTSDAARPDADLGLVRLLSIARLTPAQAVALGTDVFTELEKRHGDGRDAPPVPLGLESVRVGADGNAYLVEDDAPRQQGAQGTQAAAAALLDDLAAAAWRPTAETERPLTGALATLDRAAAAARLPDAGIPAIASTLRDADATGGAEARAELARMVSAVQGGGLAPPPQQLIDSRAPTPRPSRPQRRPRSLARALAGRTWKWVLSIVVLVAVVVIEIALLRDTIARDIDAVLDAGRSGTDAVATTTANLLPLPPEVPATAGTVTGVDLRAVRQCTPDSECEVRLQVALQPTAEPQTVTWAFQVFDRCTGATTTAPGGTVTVPPDGDRAVAVVSVALPAGDALAVLARTDLPSIAASAPVLVPSDGGCGTPAAEPSG